MPPQREKIHVSLSHLAPHWLIGFVDFIGFLRQRDQGLKLKEGYSEALESAFSTAWDNSEDAVYDDV